MKKGFTLIELLVTISIFSIVLSIIIFFYIQSQRHIVREQGRGCLDDMAVVNLDKIREKIIRAENVVSMEEKKIKLLMRNGEVDSVFEIEEGVVSGKKRFCPDAQDSIFFLWQDPCSDEFLTDVLDIDDNEMLEGLEMKNLKIIYIRYKIIKNREETELRTSIYLRK